MKPRSSNSTSAKTNPTFVFQANSIITVLQENHNTPTDDNEDVVKPEAVPESEEAKPDTKDTKVCRW